MVNENKFNKTQEEEEEEDSAVRLLREMGYKQELYRGFSAFMSFAFCFTSTNVLASISTDFTQQMSIGGSSVASCAWFIGSFFTILVSFSLAEICSVYPSAGSVYHWAGQLMVPRHAPLSSFICGWFNFVGNSTSDAAFACGFATFVNSALIIAGKEPLSLSVQTAIGIAALFGWAATNAFRIDQQGWFNNFAAFFQIGAVISTIIIVLVLSPDRSTAKTVFTSTYNGTGFPFAYVCFISIVPTLYAFSGYEGGAHMAEETRHAGRAAPIGLLCTTACNAVVGGIFMFSLMFAVPNINALVDKINNMDEPINLVIAIYQTIVPGGIALGLTIVLIINMYLAGMASLTATSRVAFAMARDGVFPGSSFLRGIFAPTKTPLITVFFVFIVDSMFMSLQLASSAAFSDMVDTSTLCLQISYLIPIALRCTVARKSFQVGEFNLGPFGQHIATIASIWLSITSIIMFFPNTYPVTGNNMNYAIAIVSGIAVIASIYWVVDARHWFVGPKQTHVDWSPLLPLNNSARESTETLLSSNNDAKESE